jgi:DNA-binding XRE family transcriptional regulator
VSLTPNDTALEELRRVLGPKLRAQRESCGLTQAELAARVGFATHSTITRIEAGVALPSLVAWVAICEALRVDPGPLLRAANCASCLDAPPAGFSCLACGAYRR